MTQAIAPAITSTRPYSQNDEEAIILDRLDRVGAGLLFDIGAYDGITFSNSRRLIECGWSAVLVEPQPEPFQRLVELYADNERVHLVNAALTRSRGSVEFFSSYAADGSIEAYGTTSRRETERWHDRLGIEFRPTTCPAIVWSDLLDRYGNDVRFITIDIEGANTERLFELDLRGLAGLELVCIERDVVPGGHWTGTAETMRRFAANARFELIHETPENLLFSRAE